MGETPVDVFETHEFHREIAQSLREVPFEHTTIRVLSCEALVVFKTMFNRTRHWADVEAVLQAGTVDTDRVLDGLRSLIGLGDPALVRLSALVEGYF